MVSNIRSRWIAVVAVSYLIAGVALFGSQGGAKGQRGFVAGRFALILDNANVGFLRSFEGGEISADVLEVRAGNSLTVDKHPGQPRYGNVDLQFGFAMGSAVYDWISATLALTPQRKSGAISTLNLEMKEMSRIEFFNSLISEITFPECDGSSKEPDFLVVSLAPEFLKYLKGSGGNPATALSGPPPRLARPGLAAPSRLQPSAAGAAPPSPSPQKIWLPSNFRLKIDGLDCSRVTKIEALTIKQSIAQAAPGNDRLVQRLPGRLEYPNLVFYVPESFSDGFRQYFDDFVVQGNAGNGKEKGGTLEFLSPNRQEVMMTLKFSGLGIFKCHSVAPDPGREGIRQVKVSMYCEAMTLDAKPKPAG